MAASILGTIELLMYSPLKLQVSNQLTVVGSQVEEIYTDEICVYGIKSL